MGESPAARLREFREHLGLGQGELADAIGISAPTISRTERDDRKPSKGLMEKLFRRYGVSQDWLMNGVGDMYVQAISADPIDEAPDDQDYMRVRRFDVSAAAGNGHVNYGEQVTGHISFPRSWLRDIGMTGKECGVILVDGDSMAPTVPAGSLALVDFSARQFEPRKIHIFIQNGEMRIKRIWPGIDGIALISDNSAYVDETLNAEEAAALLPVGRVRAVINPV